MGPALRSRGGAFAVDLSAVEADMPDRTDGDRSDALEAAGAPIGGDDMLIAAHALASGRTMVTADADEFGRVEGLAVESWLDEDRCPAMAWRLVNLLEAGEVDGMYLAPPTRTSAVRMHGRVRRVLDAVFGAEAPPAVLAVPGHLEAGDAEGTRPTRWDVPWSDDPEDIERDARRSAERARHFLAARIAVGTVGVEARLRLSGERHPAPPPLAKAERRPCPAPHGVAPPPPERAPDEIVAPDRRGAIDGPSEIARQGL